MTLVIHQCQFLITNKVNMKKFLPILFSLALLAHQAQAANSVFVGVDMLQTTAKHTSAAGPTSVGPSVTTYTDPDNSSRRSSDLGLGFNAGLRFDPARFHVANNLYLSGEVFFEELNSSAKGYDQIVTGAGPKIRIDNRYGARANAGIKVLPHIAPFVSWGLARTQYRFGTLDFKRTLFSTQRGCDLKVAAAFSLQKIYKNESEDNSPLVLKN
jgi:hypothetical protein